MRDSTADAVAAFLVSGQHFFGGAAVILQLDAADLGAFSNSGGKFVGALAEAFLDGLHSRRGTLLAQHVVGKVRKLDAFLAGRTANDLI